LIIHDCNQNTPEWFELRRGKPTSSGADRLITATGKPSKAGLASYARELAGDVLRGTQDDKWQGNQHTERGHNLEPVAADAYEFIFNRKLSTVGFCTDDDERYGASPDRLTDDNGLVEIKCFDYDAHINALVYYSRHKKPPGDRLAQCQMQLYVTGYRYVDLFYYHKTLPELRIRILPIKTYFESLECQINDVIEERNVILKILEGMK